MGDELNAYVQPTMSNWMTLSPIVFVDILAKHYNVNIFCYYKLYKHIFER